MNVNELRMDMMKSKKTDPDRSKVLRTILGFAQITAKQDGNREVEEKDIIKAAKKEIKLVEASKASGAYFNPVTFEVCEEFMPKTLGVVETTEIVQAIVDGLPEKSMKMMGKVMGQLAKYGATIDKGLASKLTKELLQ